MFRTANVQRVLQQQLGQAHNVNPLRAVESNFKGLQLRTPPNESWANKVMRHVSFHQKREQRERNAMRTSRVEDVAMSANREHKSDGWAKLEKLQFYLDNDLNEVVAPNSNRWSVASVHADGERHGPSLCSSSRSCSHVQGSASPCSVQESEPVAV